MPTDSLEKLLKAEKRIKELKLHLKNCNLGLQGTKARIETQLSKIKALKILNDTFSKIIEDQKIKNDGLKIQICSIMETVSKLRVENKRLKKIANKVKFDEYVQAIIGIQEELIAKGIIKGAWE